MHEPLQALYRTGIMPSSLSSYQPDTHNICFEPHLPDKVRGRLQEPRRTFVCGGAAIQILRMCLTRRKEITDR